LKVFLSWSGSRSQEVANLLNDWLCCVIQASRPWISTRDLDRGSLWFGEISDQLKDTTVGIICLTQENKNRPWILFEAGALAKGLSTSRVCTFLIDLAPKDIEDLLAQFNHTFPTKESLLGLVKTLNSTLGNSGLDVQILQQVFHTYWPQFEEKFAQILENTRTLSSRIRRIERETEIKIINMNKSDTVNEADIEKMAEMLEEGIPAELIVKHFSKRMSIRHIKLAINELRMKKQLPDSLE
jgi:hypothetical protein